ncbi:MAG TPA: MBL fold metallo-hydrolase [Elusimicrobiales bacterium]|mgnify:CR=1 FL=1|nr:MBL fold metallo-hydrolase [Elusimicrobiales bacterium]
MSINYRSFCSGSRGNAALLWTAAGGLLIDFAPGCQRDCRAALAGIKKISGVAAVLVTHAHGDHINRNSLKVLKEEGLTVRCHPETARQIKERHGAEYAGIIQPFEGPLVLGGWTVRQVPVEHVPGCHTVAFIATAAAGRRRYKASFFTDLLRFTDEHVALAADSDLVCLEANHDAELFKSHGHPGSEFHLSNLQAARFLHGICGRGGKQPGHVVLGHLSEDCNRPHLPLKEIEAFFGRNNLAVKFKTHVAPRRAQGLLLTIK